MQSEQHHQESHDDSDTWGVVLYMLRDLIISELKEYVPPQDYALHDWETIVERREKYLDDVYIYHLVYSDIYLTDSLEFYDAEPKQPIHNGLVENGLSVENEIIADALKEYIPPQDYALHDWNNIILRREKVVEGVYSYPCVYANIMLTESLEFYDAEPKQPIHDDLIGMSEEYRLIADVLGRYVPFEYRQDADWSTIISRREQVTESICKYGVGMIDFYLDDSLEPVEYGNVHMIDNKIYYDFELDGSIEDDGYILLSELN